MRDGGPVLWRVFLQACAPLKLHVILVSYVGLVKKARLSGLPRAERACIPHLCRSRSKTI